MAKTKEKTKKELSIEEKLRALYNLQYIDSKIDELKNVRGELPLEVKDLEDEIEGLKNKIKYHQEDIAQTEESIHEKQELIKSSKELKKRYSEQQKSVRNNREYGALNKEIEYQDLEIKVSDKKIAQFELSVEQKKEIIAEFEKKLDERNSHLKHKNSELKSILEETKKEEKLLIKKSKEFSISIDDRLLKAYHRIRNNVNNGLAVVSIERGASAGSYFTIPPQRQVEIAQRKKIITDEHSGRILVDNELATEEKEKIDLLIQTMKSKK